ERQGIPGGDGQSSKEIESRQGTDGAGMPSVRLRPASDRSRADSWSGSVAGVALFRVSVNMRERRVGRGIPLGLAIVLTFVSGLRPLVRAQAPARGQNVVPVYEGF